MTCWPGFMESFRLGPRIGTTSSCQHGRTAYPCGGSHSSGWSSGWTWLPTSTRCHDTSRLTYGGYLVGCCSPAATTTPSTRALLLTLGPSPTGRPPAQLGFVRTYRGLLWLVRYILQDEIKLVLMGCPLLLQLWLFERFSLRRPLLEDTTPYKVEMYHGGKVTWMYELFVEQFNHLMAYNVCWEPYSPEELEAHAPNEFSSLCWHDRAYWLMRGKLVFNVFIKDYVVYRVMYQFDLRQVVTVPVGQPMPDNIHAHTRKGVRCGLDWATKMEAPQTRARMVLAVNPPVAHVPSPTDTYPVHYTQNVHHAVGIGAEIVRDSPSLLQRIADSVDVTRKEVVQAFHRVQVRATHVVSLLSCTRLPEANTLMPGRHSVRPPVPSVQQHTRREGQCGHIRHTLTRPEGRPRHIRHRRSLTRLEGQSGQGPIHHQHCSTRVLRTPSASPHRARTTCHTSLRTALCSPWC